jgi:hypothetical protein
MIEARALAQRYLPADAMERSAGPPVSLIYFQDARGYPERILLDPLHFMRLTNRADVLGHELRHHYRNEVARDLRPFGDDLLAWTLETVESEGIARMVDKRVVPTLSPAALRALSR